MDYNALVRFLEKEGQHLLYEDPLYFMPHPIEEYDYGLVADYVLEYGATMLNEQRIESVVQNIIQADKEAKEATLVKTVDIEQKNKELQELSAKNALLTKTETTVAEKQQIEEINRVNRDAYVHSIVGTTPVDNTKPMLKTFKTGLLYLYDLGRMVQQAKGSIVKGTVIVSAPIVATIELILGIISVLLVMVEAFLTNRHNENVTLHRQLYEKAELLVEKLPDVYPIDELETGNEPDAIKERLRYLFSFTSKKTTFQEVEETFAMFKISKGEGMDGNNVDDVPLPALTETVELGLDDTDGNTGNKGNTGSNTNSTGNKGSTDKKDKVGVLVDFIVFPIKVKEFIKSEGLPFQASMVVRKKRDNQHSFLFQVEHLLNETTAILKRMSSQDNTIQNRTVKQKAADAAAEEERAKAAKADPKAAMKTTATVEKTPAQKEADAEAEKEKGFIGYLKELREASKIVTEARKVFVEDLYLTDEASNNKDNLSFENLLYMYEIDNDANFLSRNFIQLSKYILQTYLSLLK